MSNLCCRTVQHYFALPTEFKRQFAFKNLCDVVHKASVDEVQDCRALIGDENYECLLRITMLNVSQPEPSRVEPVVAVGCSSGEATESEQKGFESPMQSASTDPPVIEVPAAPTAPHDVLLEPDRSANITERKVANDPSTSIRTNTIKKNNRSKKRILASTAREIVSNFQSHDDEP
ncbi:hypothetical protein CYMTET_2610 [Cymbomonas tetramitiformis]|uniref:Uncharacterized protein n=1 Tax=Cymbomonas tetramitiformis TaxID=36881 RepID=A0AAE0CD59_9CHLO|nr:hypothetical protein CYMTET_38986 [Cymbomonas tetramitiformis]KAK3290007.1 hypothetical protein CYMTET_2610 [Cymbomonas tetramitiformis]